MADFEIAVLQVVAQFRGEGYGMTIRRQVEEVLSREVSIGAIYTALSRLENKGFISARMGEATPERGGRAKRYFQIQAPGRRALINSERVATSFGVSDPRRLDMRRKDENYIRHRAEPAFVELETAWIIVREFGFLPVILIGLPIYWVAKSIELVLVALARLVERGAPRDTRVDRERGVCQWQRRSLLYMVLSKEAREPGIGDLAEEYRTIILPKFGL